MKIAESSQNLQSFHNYTEIYERRESVTITDREPSDKLKKGKHDRLDLHPKNHKAKRQNILEKLRSEKLKGQKKTDDKLDEISISDMKTRVMKMVLEEITGKKISVYDPDQKEGQEQTADKTADSSEPAHQEGASREVTFHYELSEVYYQRESLSFEAAGSVTTEDGRSINFSASLSQSREIYEEKHSKLTTTGVLVDPLVINTDGKGVQLSDEKINFDLTGDGNDESISKLQSGSAFLALDRNKDGAINNGTELFGPSSGNGYDELRELDSDQNGWIDENDELFYELRLWAPGEESSPLLERGVGAISLTAVGGNFSLKNDANETQGIIREQGIWLHEETGQAGFVQEIDLMA